MQNCSAICISPSRQNIKHKINQILLKKLLTKQDFRDILVKHFALHPKGNQLMYEKNLQIGYLLDFYGEVLTDRKRNVLDMYYNEDYSLSEISEEIGISRQGVRELIKKAEEELCFLEAKLGLSKKMEELSKQTDSIISLATAQSLSPELYDKIYQLKRMIEQ